MPVTKLCQLLKVSRSCVYYVKQGVSEQDVYIMNEIRSIYEKWPFLGYRKIHAVLRDDRHIKCNRKKVQRLMKLMGLQALYPTKRKSTSIANSQHKKYSYLLKGMLITRPDQAYQVDITYIKLRKGFGYLVCLIDIYSRKIMGWAFSPFLDTHMCLEALEMALKEGDPEIINSDQGCQFTSKAWCETLIANGIKISMDGKGRWVDNVYVERLWRTIKWEAVYLHSFDTISQAKKVLAQYIIFYNQTRPHQSLDYKKPDDVYYKNRVEKELGKAGQEIHMIQTEGVLADSKIQAKIMS